MKRSNRLTQVWIDKDTKRKLRKIAAENDASIKDTLDSLVENVELPTPIRKKRGVRLVRF